VLDGDRLIRDPNGEGNETRCDFCQITINTRYSFGSVMGLSDSVSTFVLAMLTGNSNLLLLLLSSKLSISSLVCTEVSATKVTSLARQLQHRVWAFNPLSFAPGPV